MEILKQMNNQNIKELLLTQFKVEFDIQKIADLYNSETETFEYNLGFEYNDSSKNWHEVVMNVYGIIYKTQPEMSHIFDQQECDDIEIESWNFQKLEIYLDGKCISKIISFNELIKTIEL